MAKKRRRRPWNAIDGFETAPSDDAAKAAAAPHRLRRSVPTEVTSDSKWVLDFGNENVIHSLSAVTSKPPGHSVRERPTKLTLPLAPRLVATPAPNASSPPNESTRRITIHPVSQKKAAAANCDTGAMDVILSFEDKESLKGADNEIGALVTQNHSTGVNPGPERDATGRTENSAGETVRVNSSLVASRGLSESDAESVLPSSTVMSQEQDACVEDRESLAHHGGKALSTKPCSSNVAIPGRTGPLSTIAQPSRILVPDSCHIQMEDSPFGIPRETLEQAWVPKSATIQVLVPDTPDQAMQLSNSEVGDTKGPLSTTTAQVEREIQKSPVARNLLQAMELTDSDPRPVESDSDSLFRDEKSGAATTDVHAEVAGTRNDERMSEEGEGSFSGAQDSNCSGDRSVIVATSSSRTLSEQPSSCGTGQHETGQDESESGERMPCIAEGKLKRILTQVGLSPGSIGPNQSLALDPIATKDAWDLLNRYGGFDSSSASLRQNQSVTGDGGRIEESNEDDEMTASSPSEVCPTTPHKKPAVSRLSLDQNAGSSYSSLGSNGTPGGSNVRRFDVCGESQDIFNSSLAAFRANDRQAEGDNITTPKALIATRQGIGVNGSSTKGSNTGRSSVRGKENREVQPPRRLQLTPVPLDLTDEPDDEATKRQIPVPSKARPGEGTSPKNLDVEMTKPEAPIGNIPDSRLGDVGANENIGTAKHSQQGNDDISLKRGLFLSERKGMPTLDIFMDNNPAVMVSGFTTAKGTALAVSKKKLHEICLENLNLEENSQELEAKTFAEERESRYISRSGLPAKKNARPDEHDPSAAVGKPAKRPRESLESMVLNDNGPNTPFLQRRQPGFVSMFTTGKGAPVPVPNSSRLNEARRVLDGDGKKMSMFSTGKGVPLPEPSLMQLDQARRRLEKGEMRPPLQSSGHKLKRRESLESFAFQEPPPEFKTPRLERNQPAFSSMFQTGKGVPLPAPTLRQLDQAKQRLGGGEMKTPLFSDLRSTVLKNNPAAHSGTGQMSLFSNDTPFQPLFQNGRRRSVNILQANQPLARVLPFHLATSPREPPVPKMGGRAQHDPVDLKISAPDSSKRVSFRALPRSTSKPSGTLLTGTSSNRHLLFRTPPAKANGFPKATNARVRASAMKGTPFKRPRRVAPVTPRQPTNSKGNTLRQTKSLSLIFPKGLVPRLSSFGRLIPPSGENATGSNAEGRDLEGEGNHSNRQTMSSPVFVADPAQGLSVVLFKESFGDWHIFPKELKDFVKFESISTFSVENCMSLLSHVFPAAEQKAATRIGSRAWTRMSYALSVWKLYRLENGADRSEHSRPVFLTAANIIRDLWRRIDREWHNNQAPHLTQMLRRDASPRSHIVLIVSNISERGTGDVVIEVSDGWYICRLKPCNVLLSRIQAGFLKVGDKIHVSDSDLISVSNLEQFFFGDGDELGTSILAPKANCVKRVRRELTSKCMLGIRKTPLFTRTMRGLQPAGGMCPGAQVAILRSYPVFYIESNSRDSEKHSIFRRQEAEEAAQAVFENDLRESRMVAGNGNEQEFQQRAVSSAVDISVTGILDNALDSAAERSVRIYRPNEEVLRLLSKEGSVVQLPAMKPNGKLWVALSLAVRPVAVSDYSRIPAKPRCASTCADLISTTIPAGTDFDGVYTVLHLAESGADSTQRFAFLLDNLDKLTPIALELKGVDAETVPRAISRARKPDQYPIVVLRDATKTGIDDERGIIHATVTLRTEILSAAGLKRRKGPSWTYLQERLRKVEKDQEDEAKSKAKLEVNREAVMSFTSGRRRSISAYFSSTQDSQPQA